MLDTCLKLLDLGYFEAKIAFDGLADANVWKRPASGLVSIGEIAGHVAYWQAVKFAGDGKQAETDDDKRRVHSLLIDWRFRYLPTTLQNPPSQEHLSMGAVEVRSELLRVHKESMEQFKNANIDLETSPAGYAPNFKYGALLQYAVFHVAYHTGQIYTARHLLGEETPDN